MKELEVLDIVEVRGRGKIYVVELAPQQKVELGEEVVLDGELRIISGIERALNLTDPPHYARQVGLLTKEVKVSC